MTPIRICATKLLVLVILASSFGSGAAQAAMIGLIHQTPLGTDASGQVVDRFTYSISDVTLKANQLIDIQFDATDYSALANPRAGTGFTTYVLQPGNPQGTQGDYNLLVSVENPSLSGPFSVDVTFANGPVSAAEPFLIEQFDQNGNFLGILESGSVDIPDEGTSSGAVPEPANLVLPGGLALFMAGALRRRFLGSGHS